MLQVSKMVKLRIATPVDAAGAVREALGKSGAGKQGNYEWCSTSYRQIGRFKPLAGASPAVGEVGKYEEVEEEVVETFCEVDNLQEVIQAVKKVHPYEEPVIDIMPLLTIE